jgi:hypothetical protein
MLTDETSFKLHTAPDGIVWYASGINPTESSHQDAESFLTSNIISRVNLNVRLLGIPQNADLIVNLYARKRKRELGTIYVAGPNVCESMLELNDPFVTVRRMRSVFVAASCGGWHELSDADAAVYSLISRMQRSNDWFDVLGRVYFESHPLFKGLNAVGGLSYKNTASLMALIVDPRWYVDRRRPDNPGKLCLYLGLTPKTQGRVSDCKKIVSKGRDLRCAMVLSCWKTQSPDTVDFDAPENFLWRIWQAAGGGVKGDLRASQAFVGYVRDKWLDALVSRQGLREELFLPDKFFKTTAEKQAYIANIA